MADQNEEDVAEKEVEKKLGEEDDTIEMRKEVRNDGSKFLRAKSVFCANLKTSSPYKKKNNIKMRTRMS